MRDAVSIIAPAIDDTQIARAITAAHIAWQDDERNADAHERKSSSYRESASRHRLELGRLLIEAKGAIKHGGWLPFLEKQGISSQSASEWMRLAGWVESNSRHASSDGNLPIITLAEAGIDKRPRKRDEKPDDDPPSTNPQRSTPDRNSAQNDTADPDNSESVVLASLIHTLGVVARQWPGDPNRLITELRRYADKLERRTKGN